MSQNTPTVNSTYSQVTKHNNTKIISVDDIKNILTEVEYTTKARKVITLHDDFTEIPQRFVNCLHQHSYISPHMHTDIKHWELINLVYGDMYALIFSNDGILLEKYHLTTNGIRIIEIHSNCYHTYVANTESAFLEICNNDYDINNPQAKRVNATWAAAEGSSQAIIYLDNLRSAKIGDNLSHMSNLSR